MLSYYLKCRKNTETKNPKVARTKDGSGLLNSLGINTPLNKIPLLDSLLF